VLASGPSSRSNKVSCKNECENKRETDRGRGREGEEGRERKGGVGGEGGEIESERERQNRTVMLEGVERVILLSSNSNKEEAEEESQSRRL
jgi:hypothetical protein